LLKLGIQIRTIMSELNIEKEKLEIIKWVTGLKDNTAIERLRMLRENPRKLDWWNEITDEEKTAIDKGLADIKAGRVKPHKEAKKLYEKWL
jgi:hypothetical protein